MKWLPPGRLASAREVCDQWRGMVDSTARKCAADLVEKYRDGMITNFEFDEYWPSYDLRDRGIRAIETMLWHYCDDFRKHTLSGKHALEETDRALFDRCAVFLKTNLEYEWTVDDFLVTGRDFENRLRNVGLYLDDPYWPFWSRGAYRDHRNPRTSDHPLT